MSGIPQSFGAADCAVCRRPTPAAASFCGWCGERLAASSGWSTLARPEGRIAPRPAGVAADCAEPWAAAADGRTLFLFHGDREGRLGVARADAALAPWRFETAPARAPAEAARGLAVTRRGAFIATREGLFATVAPTTPDGAWTQAQWRLPRDGQIIGLTGVGGLLTLAAIEGERLTIRRGAGVARCPPVLATTRWPGVAPAWLRLYPGVDPGRLWLWGAGLLGRADLEVGAIRLRPHPSAPAEPVALGARRGAAQDERMASGDFDAPVAAPMAGGAWGLLDLGDGVGDAARAHPVGLSLTPPLATAGGGGGVTALYGDFLLHAVVEAGVLRERQARLAPMLSGSLLAGPGGLVALTRPRHGPARLTEVVLRPGSPPLVLADAPVGEAGEQDQVLAALPPVRLAGEIVAPLFSGVGVGLWACPVADAA